MRKYTKNNEKLQYNFPENYLNVQARLIQIIDLVLNRSTIQIPQDEKIESEPVRPTISIIVTVFNQSFEVLDQLFTSICEQTSAPDEVIVIDSDSSNLETLLFLQNLEEAKRNDFGQLWKFLKVPDFGFIEARHKGAELCGSKYLVFFDPDDFLHLDYVHQIRETLFCAPTADMVYPNVFVLNGPSEALWQTGPADLQAMLYQNRLPMSSVIRKSIFQEVGKYRSVMKNGMEDWDLWVRLLCNGARMVHSPNAYYYYKSNQIDSLSNRTRKFNHIQRAKIFLEAKRLILKFSS